MILVVDTLEPSVYQTVRRDKVTHVEAIRPHIYRHRWPSGSVRAVIETTDGRNVATGEWQSITDIGTQDFFHGYVRLYVNASLRPDTDYRIKIEAGDGYSFTESAYLGVCNGYDLGRYPADYNPASDLHEPLDLEIWERR